MRNWRKAIHEILSSASSRKARSIVAYCDRGWLWHPWNHNKRHPCTPILLCLCCSTCKFYSCMLPLAFYPNFYDPLAPEPWYNLLLFCARRSAQQLVLTRHLSPKFKVLGLISILSTPFQTRIYWFHSFINVVTSAQSARQRKYFVNRHFDIFTLTNLLYLKKRPCVCKYDAG